MSLLLKEISGKDHDKALLHVFSKAREKVLAVAVSPLLPDVVGVTTQKGFVELINVKSGDFRLFLTHLDHIALETDLRCFTFAPCLLAALSEARRAEQTLGGTPITTSLNDKAAPPPPHCLVYSVAYSNQLLVAEVDSGCVAVLAECDSRPSAVTADGDYIVCGEGSGRLTAWRLRDSGSVSACGRSLSNSHNGSAGAGRSALFPPLPSLLEKRWSSNDIHEDAIASLIRRRHQLFCCGADMTCHIVHIDTGIVIGKLVQEPAPIHALYPLLAGAAATALSLSPRDARGTMIAAYGYQVVLYREAEPQYDPAGEEVEVELVVPTDNNDMNNNTSLGSTRRPPQPRVSAPPAPKPTVYTFEGECRTNVPLTCLTCSHRYIAAGSLSGVVILYYCDPAFGTVEELVRFDVGYSVVAIQLFDGDGAGGQPPVAPAPLPSDGEDVLLVVTASGDVWRWPMRDLLQPLEEHAAAAGSSSSSGLTSKQEGDAGKVPDGDHSESATDEDDNPVPLAPAPAPHHRDHDSLNGAGAGASSRDRTGLSASPSVCEANDDGHAGLEEEVDVVEVVLEEKDNDNDNDNERHRRERNRCQDVDALKRFLGSLPAEIPGLRHGRRMDPRVVDAVLDNAAAHQLAVIREAAVLTASEDRKRVLWAERGDHSASAAAAEDNDHAGKRNVVRGDDLLDDEMEDGLPPLPLASSSLHGTTVRLQCAEDLLEQEVDVEAIRAAHPLLADSLQFQFPVKTRVLGLSESAYAAVPELAAKAAQETMETKTGLSSAALKAGQAAAAKKNNNVVIGGQWRSAERTEESGENTAVGASASSSPLSSSPLTESKGNLQHTSGASDLDSLRDVTYDTFRRRKDPRLEEERQRPGPHIQHHFVHDALFGFGVTGHHHQRHEDAFILFKEFQAQPTEPRGLLFPLPLPSTFPVY